MNNDHKRELINLHNSELWGWMKEELGIRADKRSVIGKEINKDYNMYLDMADLNNLRGRHEMLEAMVRLVEKQL